MAILVTDEVGEGNLGMVTAFCHHNQAKMETSNALSVLHQCDLLEPSVVVVRRYTETPLYPLRVLLFPLSRCKHSLQGCFLHPVPTGPAMLMQITPLF